MQFALPPRKLSHSPPFVQSSSVLRRQQLKSIAILGCIVFSVLFLVSQIFSPNSSTDSVTTGDPKAVIVTVLDEGLSDKYIQQIKENREDYARRHGYVNFFASTSQYAQVLGTAPRSWAIVPALRHAMTLFPHSTYFFQLSPHALIMNPSLSLTSHILETKRLESLMRKDVSVVPPDSVIKTFSHVPGSDVDLIISQDKENLSPGSFILKRGDWAHFFLDSWFDPLYRSYNFAKAENHALDHIVQWHPTILAKLALVPQRVMNSYSAESKSAAEDGKYKDNDFIVRLAGCDTELRRNCEKEMESYWRMVKK